jgi:hypothetical protein
LKVSIPDWTSVAGSAAKETSTASMPHLHPWSPKPGRPSGASSADACTASTCTAAFPAAPPSSAGQTSISRSSCTASRPKQNGPRSAGSLPNSTRTPTWSTRSASSSRTVLDCSPAAERYDNAFQISCLCTPLWGPDLAEELPDQYPTIELARHITSGTQTAFTRLSAALADPTTPRPDFVRQRVGRRITRLAFSCVLFRWPGWTSDPTTIQRVVTAFYPDHADELATSIHLGWGRLTGHPPVTPDDHDTAIELLTRSAPWWMNEHRKVTAETR